jgi:hypothetical protein
MAVAVVVFSFRMNIDWPKYRKVLAIDRARTCKIFDWDGM